MPKVNYFGILAEQIAKSDENWSLDTVDLHDFVAKIKTHHSLEQFDFQVAVNRKIISDLKGVELQESDEIAFLPAFAGG